MQLVEENRLRLVRLILIQLFLVAFVLVLNVPFIWMVTTSLKIRKEVFTYPPRLFGSEFSLKGYAYVWTLVPFARYLFNSLFVSTAVGVSRMILASMAAYAFAKIPFRGSKQVFYIFLGTMMIPFEVIVIPNYIIVKTLGWLDTYLALIVPLSIRAFSIFLLRQFFLQIPKDLDDAAEIDGCRKLRYLFTIIYPLAKPALLTVGLYSYLESWNSFLWPLVVTNKDTMRVVQIGLSALSDPTISTQWNEICAATTMATLPIIILFFFVQKHFLEGITITGMKS
jgi:multiple sugar transport system permease protein